MIRGPTRLFLRIALSVLLILVAGAGFALWRLSQAPWSLDFARPYVEKALSDPAAERVVTVGETLLVWDPDEREIAIRLHDLVVARPNGSRLVALPDTNVRLGVAQLLRGVVAPSEVTILKPVVTAVRERDGSVHVGIGDAGFGAPIEESGAPVGERIRAALAGGPGAPEAVRTLQQIRVVDATVSIDDRQLGRAWKLEEFDLSLDRGRRGVQAGAAGRVMAAGARAEVTLNALWDPAEDLLSGQARAEGLDPSRLAALAPEFAELAAVEAKTVLGARFAITGSNQLRELDATLELKEGRILHASVPKREVKLRSGRAQLRLAGDGATFDGQLELEKAITVTVKGTGQDLRNRTALDLDLRAANVPVDEFPGLWPADVAPNPRRWIVANLSQGTVRTAHLELKAERPAAGLALAPTHVRGGLTVADLRVTYLGKLPAVEGVSGTATYGNGRLDIQVHGGQTRRLKIDKGAIAVTGLDGNDHRIALDLDIAGPLSDALYVLDQPPLGYIRKFGQKPEAAQGDARANVKLAFPLLDALKLTQIDMKVDASLTGGRLPKVVRDLDLSEGNFHLTADQAGLEMTGDGKLGPVPVRLAWLEQFADRVPFRRRFEVRGSVDSAQRKALGLDLAPYLAGPADVVAELVENDGGVSTLSGSADLKAATLAVEEIGWSKPAQAAAMARWEIAMRNQRLQALTAFSFSGGGLETNGSGQFGGDSRITRVDMKRLRFGATDLAGRIDLRPDGTDVALRGPSLDASKLIERARNEPPAGKEPPGKAKRFQGQFDRVIIAPGRDFQQVRFEAQNDGKTWRLVDVKAAFEGAPFQFQVQPLGDARTLTASTPDAGALLRAFDVTDYVIGGKAVVTGRLEDDGKGGERLTAHLDVTDYRIVKMPFLAQLLAVASITGIPELLTGEGIAFRSMVADVTRDETKWEIKDGRAAGLAMGINVRGTIDRASSEADLAGTIVPIYALNRVIGAIPLLGDILTGGEGGGLFAWTYRATGPVENPKVSVNPLSGFAPGFLRNLFERIDSPGEPQAQTPPEFFKPKPIGEGN